jgi:hypothetical protein
MAAPGPLSPRQRPDRCAKRDEAMDWLAGKTVGVAQKD